MRWIAGAMLGVVVLAGCLGTRTVQCADGVVCPEGQACAQAPFQCGPEGQVAACLGEGKADYDACRFSETSVGACRGGVCFECTAELAGCRHDGWTRMSSPTDVPLNDVWVADVANAYAVGGDGTLLHYDGFGWSVSETFPTLPRGVALTSVWGSDASNVFVTSTEGNVYRSEASSWHVVATAPNQLTALGGTGPNDVIAVGRSGTVVRYDGTTWTTETISTLPLYGVWARAPNDVVVVGASGEVLRYGEGRWSAFSPPPITSSPAPALRAVWGGPANVVVVGDFGLVTSTVLVFNGVDWAAVRLPGAPQANLFGVWQSEARDVLLVGQTGLIVRGHGGSWSAMPSSVTTDLNSVDGDDGRDAFAVGDSGTIVHYTDL